MTGPENYRRAEDLATQADETGEKWLLDLAILHAIQANTAAVAMSNRTNMPEDVVVEWDEVCRLPEELGHEPEQT